MHWADIPRADISQHALGQTPLPGRHPLLGRHIPAWTGADNPPTPGQTATAVDGTHPTTIMHFCYTCTHD